MTHVRIHDIRVLLSCAIVIAALLLPHAASAIEITNTVRASSQTGGKTIVNGADGADGEDGRDGADGEDGRDGVSVTGTSQSSVHVRTVVDGEVVTDIRESSDDVGTAAVSVGTSVVEETRAEDTNVTLPVAIAATATATHSSLPSLLDSLRSLLSFVTNLF